MIKICIALLVTCAAIFIGPYLADSQGYIHIATNDYIIEMSVVTGTVLTVIAFIIFYFAVNFVLSVMHLPHGASLMLKRRADKKQITWHKRDEAITWFHPDNYDSIVKFINQETSENT